MIRLLWLLVLHCWVGLCCVWAAAPAVSSDTLTMRELWVEMPDSLLALVARSERLDARDYLASGMRAEVNNVLGGRSTLEILTPRLAQVRLTPASTWQARLLSTSAGDQLIAVVHTVVAERPTSRIAFYSSTWQPLDVRNYLPEALHTALLQGWGSLQVNDSALTLTHTQHLPVVSGEAALIYTSTSNTYNWTGDRFALLNTNE